MLHTHFPSVSIMLLPASMFSSAGIFGANFQLEFEVKSSRFSNP